MYRFCIKEQEQMLSQKHKYLQQLMFFVIHEPYLYKHKSNSNCFNSG
jgi:hypothetical protein